MVKPALLDSRATRKILTLGIKLTLRWERLWDDAEAVGCLLSF